ncbi:MAG: SMP-30/gluconolactonase/LRE family protein [Alphaproteobacteria bacterium]
MSEPKCIVPSGDGTGEGAMWSASEGALYWVDINRFLIHRMDFASRATQSWFFDQPVTALGLTSRLDTHIVALASKVILWQPGNDARADFAAPDDTAPHTRLNDGRPDPAGSFWVGSMQNNVAPDGGDLAIDDHGAGRLFRIRKNGEVSVEKTGIGIANTLCWSPAGDRFYFGDTLKNAINVWDFSLARSAISRERPFFEGFERGLPDGSAMDRDGYLWNARYGGGCVVRVAPDGGIDRIVDLPVDNITTCTFGGPQLKTLFITTARGGNGPLERLAGGLFAMEADTPGLPENVFTLAE